jgi:hypothetical protein
VRARLELWADACQRPGALLPAQPRLQRHMEVLMRSTEHYTGKAE